MWTELVLAPTSESGTAVSIGLLAAVASALQIAVSNGSSLDAGSFKDPASIPVPRQIAWLRFLTGFSAMLVIASWFLGSCVAIEVLEVSLAVEVAAVFGPPLKTILTATIAADATVVSNPEFANAYNMRNARRIRNLQILFDAHICTAPVGRVAGS